MGVRALVRKVDEERRSLILSLVGESVAPASMEFCRARIWRSSVERGTVVYVGFCLVWVYCPDWIE